VRLALLKEALFVQVVAVAAAQVAYGSGRFHEDLKFKVGFNHAYQCLGLPEKAALLDRHPSL
jgi:hypothetical protein